MIWNLGWFLAVAHWSGMLNTVQQIIQPRPTRTKTGVLVILSSRPFWIRKTFIWVHQGPPIIVLIFFSEIGYYIEFSSFKMSFLARKDNLKIFNFSLKKVLNSLGRKFWIICNIWNEFRQSRDNSGNVVAGKKRELVKKEYISFKSCE